MLMNFKPKKYYKSIYEVDFKKLKDEGIKLVAVDLDNTLVPHDVMDAPDHVHELVKNVRNEGLDIVILSNNNQKRVERFIKEMDIDYYYSAKKPLKKVFLHLLNKYKLDTNEICLIGDQIMTDVFGANRINIVSILVEPLASRDILYTKVNRIMEKSIVKKLEKRNLFKIGEYYD